MFEKTSRLAEQVATSVSRRGFLGTLSGRAATAAMGVAGVLCGSRTAWAGGKKYTCCGYATQAHSLCFKCVPRGTPCPFLVYGCGYSQAATESFNVDSCGKCGFACPPSCG
jgi:hypothetical protein